MTACHEVEEQRFSQRGARRARRVTILALAAFAIAGAACGAKSSPPDAPGVGTTTAASEPGAAPRRAIARIAPTEERGRISGVAVFVETASGVDVTLTVDGAPPGLRAWHIHDGKSCGRAVLPDGGLDEPGTAAGPHWNPKGMPHGLPHTPRHHPGDFGNFAVDASGRGTARLTTVAFGLADPGGAADPATGRVSAIGHAVIIHAGTDDGTGESGNAGPRVGCGIIERE